MVSGRERSMFWRVSALTSPESRAHTSRPNWPAAPRTAYFMGQRAPSPYPLPRSGERGRVRGQASLLGNGIRLAGLHLGLLILAQIDFGRHAADVDGQLALQRQLHVRAVQAMLLVVEED